MTRVFRHDAITLHQEVSEEPFERFMREELAPYFNKAYARSTRKTLALLIEQFLLKDTEDRLNYLWVTVWEAGDFPEAVGGFFAGARMESDELEETVAMLKRLETFGKRSPEKLFAEFSQRFL